MIKLTTGNLLDAHADALVNTVNTIGVMGKGVALQFRQAFPQVYAAYERACARHEVQPGKMHVVETGQMMNPRYVINFPTKRHWKGKSRMEDIDSGLVALIDEVGRLGIKSIAVPPLGCGNGGLDWRAVRPRIEAAFKRLPDVEVLLFEPRGAPPADTMQVRTEKPRMTRARALFVKLIEQYCQPGYRLTLLEVQKLAYFLQEAGEPLKLNFAKEKYGPYAENLHFVLQRIEGHFIRGYGDRSRDAEIYLLPEGDAEAEAFLGHDEEARARLQKVERLIDGFETPFGLELLATVHWVSAKEAPTPAQVQESVLRVSQWNDRKRRIFEPKHVQVAWDRLHEEQWV